MYLGYFERVQIVKLITSLKFAVAFGTTIIGVMGTQAQAVTADKLLADLKTERSKLYRAAFQYRVSVERTVQMPDATVVEMLPGNRALVAKPNILNTHGGTTTPIQFEAWVDPTTGRPYRKVDEAFNVTMVNGRVRIEHTPPGTSGTAVHWYDGTKTTVTYTNPIDGSEYSGMTEGIVAPGAGGLPNMPTILGCYRSPVVSATVPTLRPQSGGAVEFRYDYETGHDSYLIDPTRNHVVVSNHGRIDDKVTSTVFGDFKNIGGYWFPGFRRAVTAIDSDNTPQDTETATYKDIRILSEAEAKAVLEYQPVSGVNFDSFKRRFQPMIPAFIINRGPSVSSLPIMPANAAPMK